MTCQHEVTRLFYHIPLDTFISICADVLYVLCMYYIFGDKIRITRAFYYWTQPKVELRSFSS